MDEVSLEVSEKEQELILQQIKAKCIDCTIRFFGSQVPFNILQFYFFRIALLFLPYAKAMYLSETLGIGDFYTERLDITARPVIMNVPDLNGTEDEYIDPLLILAQALELEPRHQLAIAYSLGLTEFNTHKEFNTYYGVHAGFLQRYTVEVIQLANAGNYIWDVNNDGDLIQQAKECVRNATYMREDHLIKHPDGTLVSSETIYYSLCVIAQEGSGDIDVSTFTKNQLNVWRYIISKYFETQRFPTYADISTATGIGIEVVGDNVRSIFDKINSASNYRKQSNGLVKPIDPDDLVGKMIQFNKLHARKLRKRVLTDREYRVLKLTITPVSGKLYRTIPEIAAEVNVSLETVRRDLQNILDKVNTPIEDQYITSDGESLDENHLRVRLCKALEDTTFINVFNEENRRFIRLMTERVDGVFEYSNLEVERMIWGSVAEENDVDSSTRVNRKLAGIFERLDEVEVVDTTGFKIRGNRLTLIKLRKVMDPGLFKKLSASDLEVLMLVTEPKAPKIYLSLKEVAKKLNTSPDSARMRITFLLKKLNSLQES